MDMPAEEAIGAIAGKEPTEIDFARARRLWKQSRPYSKPFDSLPRAQQKFAALLSRLVSEED